MQHILIIQLARFGDFLQTHRLIKSVTTEHTQVHLCVDTSLQKLAQTLFPTAIVYTVHSHNAGYSDLEVFTAIHKLLSSLKTYTFSQVYNLNNAKLNYVFAQFFDPEISFGHKRDKGRIVQDPWLQIAFRGLKVRKKFALNLMDIWGLLSPSPIPPCKVNPVATTKNTHRIGFALAGREKRRSLTAEQIAQIMHIHLQTTETKEILLLGTLADKKIAKQVINHLTGTFSEKILDLTGKTSYLDLVEIINSLDMLYTPDTGLMHLSAHLGVPVQAFFLSSAWCPETGPYGVGHTIYQTDIHCSPCFEFEPCPYGHKCSELFSSREFLSIFTKNKKTTEHSELLCLQSRFDALGIAYYDIHTKKEVSNSSIRKIIYEYLSHSIDPSIDNLQAQLVWQESDWLFIKGNNYV